MNNYKQTIAIERKRCNTCFKILPIDNDWFLSDDKYFCSFKCRDQYENTKEQLEHITRQTQTIKIHSLEKF